MVHEVTHIVFYDATDNPFHEPARWLNEGIATWSEIGDAGDQRAIVEFEASGGGLFSFDAITEQFPIGERGASALVRAGHDHGRQHHRPIRTRGDRPDRGGVSRRRVRRGGARGGNRDFGRAAVRRLLRRVRRRRATADQPRADRAVHRRSPGRRRGRPRWGRWRSGRAAGRADAGRGHRIPRRRHRRAGRRARRRGRRGGRRGSGSLAPCREAGFGEPPPATATAPLASAMGDQHRRLRWRPSGSWGPRSGTARWPARSSSAPPSAC